MTHRALRQCAPCFELNIPQRALQPMAVVTRDATGATFAATSSSTRHATGPTKLLPHLYLGGVGDAQSTPVLERLGVRRVLNVAAECDCKGALADHYQRLSIKWRRVDLRDHSDEDIATHFDECVRFIRDGIRRGETVLVHCRFGVSRSATIVMAYLMHYGVCEADPSVMSYEESFDFVKARRPEVSPNIGFVLALHALDERQHNNRNKEQSLIRVRSTWGLEDGDEALFAEGDHNVTLFAVPGATVICAAC